MLSQSCPFITNDLFMRVITSFPARMLISFIPPHIRTLFHNVQVMAGWESTSNDSIEMYQMEELRQ